MLLNAFGATVETTSFPGLYGKSPGDEVAMEKKIMLKGSILFHYLQDGQFEDT